MQVNDKYLLRAIWSADCSIKEFKDELRTKYINYAEKSGFNDAFFIAEALKVVGGYYNSEDISHDTKQAKNKLEILLKYKQILSKISRESLESLIAMCDELFPATKIREQKYKKYLLAVYEKRFQEKYQALDKNATLDSIAKKLEDPDSGYESAKADFYKTIAGVFDADDIENLLDVRFVATQFYMPSAKSDKILKQLVLESFKRNRMEDAFILLNCNLRILNDKDFSKRLNGYTSELDSQQAEAVVSSAVKFANAIIDCKLVKHLNMSNALDASGFIDVLFERSLEYLSVDNLSTYLDFADARASRLVAIYGFILRQTDQESRNMCIDVLLQLVYSSSGSRSNPRLITELIIKQPAMALEIIKYYYEKFRRKEGNLSNREEALLIAIAQALDKLNYMYVDEIMNFFAETKVLEYSVHKNLIIGKHREICSKRFSLLDSKQNTSPLLHSSLNAEIAEKPVAGISFNDFLKRIYSAKPSYDKVENSNFRAPFAKKIQKLLGLKDRFEKQYTKVVGLLKAWAFANNCYDNSAESQRKIDNYDIFLTNLKNTAHDYNYGENFDASVKTGLETILFLLEDKNIPHEIKVQAINGLTERMAVCGPGVRQGIQECLLFLKQGDIIDNLNLFKYQCAMQITQTVFNSSNTHYVTAILKHLDANGFNMPLGLSSRVEDSLFNLDMFEQDSMRIKNSILSEYSKLYNLNSFINYLIDNVPKSGFLLEKIAEDPILLAHFKALNLCDKNGVVDENKVMLDPKAAKLKEVISNIAECISFADPDCKYMLTFNTDMDLQLAAGKNLVSFYIEKDASWKDVVVCSYTGNEGVQHSLDLYGDKWLLMVKDLAEFQREARNIHNFDARMFEMVNAFISSFPIAINSVAVRKHVIQQLKDKLYIDNANNLLESDLHSEGQIIPINIASNPENLQVVLDKKEGIDTLYFCTIDSATNKVLHSHDFTQWPLSTLEQDLLIATLNSVNIELAQRLVQHLVDNKQFEILKVVYARCEQFVQPVLLSSPDIDKVIAIIFDENIEAQTRQTLMLRMLRHATTYPEFLDAITTEAIKLAMTSNNPQTAIAEQVRSFSFNILSFDLPLYLNFVLTALNIAQNKPDDFNNHFQLYVIYIRDIMPKLYAVTLDLVVTNPRILSSKNFWVSSLQCNNPKYLEDLIAAIKRNNVVIDKNKLVEYIKDASDEQHAIFETCFELERRNSFRPR